MKKVILRLKIFLRRLFLHNFFLKLISLLFAFLLWLFVASEEKTEVSLKVPLRFVNLPRELMLSGSIPSQIDVLISGPRSLIFGLMNKRLEYRVDMKDASPGTMEVRVFPESLGIRLPLKVLQINPSSFTVQVERIGKKEVGVVPQLEGSPDRNFAVVKVNVFPERVILSGPQTSLENYSWIKTQKVNIEGINKNGKYEVSFELDNASISVTPPKVSIEIIVNEKIVKKTINGIPVKVKTPFQNYKVDPPFISLTLLGTYSKINNLKPDEIFVYIDLMEEGKGKFRRRAIIELEKDFTLLDAIPTWFDVYIF